MEKYNQTQEEFNVLLEGFVNTAKDAKARISIIKNEPDGSREQKIQLEVLYKHLVPYQDRLGSIVYGMILTYNKFPERLPSLTDKDILKAQLALDEYTKIMESSGVVVNIKYTMDDIFKESPSSHT